MFIRRVKVHSISFVFRKIESCSGTFLKPTVRYSMDISSARFNSCIITTAAYHHTISGRKEMVDKFSLIQAKLCKALIKSLPK